MKKTLRLRLELAKLGDAYLNFVASAALTLYSGKATSVKVPGKALASVYERSQLRSKCVNARRVEKAEIVEALFGYAWLSGALSAEKGVERLSSLLEKGYRLEEGLEELVNWLLSNVEKVYLERA
mgnify:CR=1 FL=1